MPLSWASLGASKLFTRKSFLHTCHGINRHDQQFLSPYSQPSAAVDVHCRREQRKHQLQAWASLYMPAIIHRSQILFYWHSHPSMLTVCRVWSLREYVVPTYSRARSMTTVQNEPYLEIFQHCILYVLLSQKLVLTNCRQSTDVFQQISYVAV